MKRDKTGPGTTLVPAGQADRRDPASGRIAKRAEKDLKVCRRFGEKLEQVARRSREALYLYLATAYRLLYEASTERSYGDTLKAACGGAAGLGGEHLAVDLIRRTYRGELPADTERKWVGRSATRGTGIARPTRSPTSSRITGSRTVTAGSSS